MSDKALIANYEKIYLKFREIILETRKAARGRLVWYVAIAGYAIINTKSIYEAISEKSFHGITILWLSLPWILTGVFSVIAHFVIDEAGAKDDFFYVNKLNAIYFCKSDIKNGIDNETLGQLIEDTHPAYQKEKKTSDKWACWARWLELCAFITLVFGFIWTILGSSFF